MAILKMRHCEEEVNDSEYSAMVDIGTACAELWQGTQSNHSHAKRAVALLSKVLEVTRAQGHPSTKNTYIRKSYIRALNTLGELYENARSPTRAKQLYEDHLGVIDNDDINIRTKLGIIYLRSEQQTEAKREFERVLRHSPTHKRASAYLGLILKLQGKLEESAVLMAVSMFPRLSNCH
jgi:tetratricopeptide (TPR) repeat protein